MIDWVPFANATAIKGETPTLDPAVSSGALQDIDDYLQAAIMSKFRVCTEVSALCPVELTTLGYYPNAGINIFFAVGFGVAAIVTFVLGMWKKTYAYAAFITAGCVLELAGRSPVLMCRKKDRLYDRWGNLHSLLTCVATRLRSTSTTQ